jgi:hypothetical protein
MQVCPECGEAWDGEEYSSGTPGVLVLRCSHCAPTRSGLEREVERLSAEVAMLSDQVLRLAIMRPHHVVPRPRYPPMRPLRA